MDTASKPAAMPGMHLLALGLFGLVTAAWLLAMLVTVRTAGQVPERSGSLIAVFPRGIGEVEVMSRVARAEGVVMRATWFDNVWQVHGAQTGFAAGLHAQGAVLVLPLPGIEALGLGGCSGTVVQGSPGASGTGATTAGS